MVLASAGERTGQTMAWAEQLPSGKYRAVYRDRNGKRRSAGTFTHKRAATNAAIVAEDESRKHGWRDPDAAGRTWAEWCAEWWDTRPVEASTLSRDVSRRDRRLMPRWGEIPLAEITRQDVRAWAKELERDGLAPATVGLCVHLLSASLSAAVDAEILPANPAGRALPPLGQTSKERYLTAEEQVTLLEQFDAGSVHRALVALLLGTGLRWGEAIGLHARRVDARRARLRVAECWDDRNRKLTAYPKGKKIRDVPIPDWVLEEITPFLGSEGHALTIGGGVIDYHNWRSRHWAPALAAAEIDGATIHDLRHTYASMLIQRGVSLAEVGRLLGHVSPTTTQRYAHLAETDDRQVRDALPRPARGANVGQDTATPDYNVLQFRPRSSGGIA